MNAEADTKAIAITRANSSCVDDSGQRIFVTVGKSFTIESTAPVRRVYIDNPKVIRSFSSTERQIIIFAKSAGGSGLILWDTAGQPRTYYVHSNLDVSELNQTLATKLPGIAVNAASYGDKIHLRGTVSSSAEYDEVVKLASMYSASIINELRVIAGKPTQVQLKLRIVEIDRSRMEQFGLNFFAAGGSTQAGLTTQQFATSVIPSNNTTGTSLSVSDPLNLLLYSSKLHAGVTI